MVNINILGIIGFLLFIPIIIIGIGFFIYSVVSIIIGIVEELKRDKLVGFLFIFIMMGIVGILLCVISTCL